MRFFLGLGSNLGDRLGYLRQATEALAARLGGLVGESPVYETAPWGKTDQPAYLNQVIAVRSNLDPMQVLAVCLEVEQAAGRQRLEHWGARTLDVDVLLALDDLGESPILHTPPTLQLPHPRLHLRRFVLEPLCALIPDARHPLLGQPLSALLAACPDTGAVAVYAPPSVSSSSSLHPFTP